MQLVMRCDDFGYTKVFNMGLEKVLEEGICTHVELMTDTPGSIDAMETLRRYPWVSVGWHQHYRGTPVLDPKSVPSLLREDGHFKFCEVWSPDMHNPKVFEGVDRGELKAELTAQLELCLEHMGRVPDFAGAGSGNVAGQVTQELCKEFGIACNAMRHVRPDGTLTDPAPEWSHVKLACVNQPSHWLYQTRTKEDSYERICKYDSLSYMLNDEQHILDLECGMMAWHPGFMDDYFFEDATYFYMGDPKYMDGSILRDVKALCDPRLRQWIRDNKVELVNMRDAVYGTRSYQNHLRQIGSDLYVGSF